MERNKYIIMMSFVLMYVIFVIISLLVIITNRHHAFVKRKLQIGVLILSLSEMIIGCNIPKRSNTIPALGPTCYEPVAPINIITIYKADKQSGDILLSTASSDTISGYIEYRHSTHLSYIISDSTHRIIQSDDILLTDRPFDKNSEAFEIYVGNTILHGIYKLYIFTIPKDSIRDIRDHYLMYNLTVK